MFTGYLKSAGFIRWLNHMLVPLTSCHNLSLSNKGRIPSFNIRYYVHILECYDIRT